MTAAESQGKGGVLLPQVHDGVVGLRETMQVQTEPVVRLELDQVRRRGGRGRGAAAVGDRRACSEVVACRTGGD